MHKHKDDYPFLDIILEPYVPPIPNKFLITEDGDFLITEDGDFLITET